MCNISDQSCGLSHDVRDFGALMVDAFEIDGHYIGCITFKDVWWEDHHGLET